MSQSTPIIEFQGVTKRFGGITALDDVTFSIPRGEIHALVGENGAGKSTLIRVCGGVFHPDGGRIIFDGKETRFRDTQDSRTMGIGIVHQEIPLCQDLTAAENIFLGQRLPRRAGMVDWNAINRQAQTLFDRLQVDIRPTDIVGRLSIAKQQLVEIAQALSLQSKLLIMDEPTSALGKQEADHLFEIIRQLKAQGISIIYVSHRLEEVFEIADRVTALRDGRYIGTVNKTETNPDHVVSMMVGREITHLFPKVAAQPRPEVLLSVRNLTVPGVYRDVNFELHPGEVLGLVGLQGSGTSDVMRTLFGQYRNVSGEITLRGKPVRFTSSLDAIKNGVAYVPADRQAEGLFRVMSVRDNTGMLILPSIAKVFGWIPLRALVEEALKAVREFSIRAASINVEISSLSGGNQQKVVIAKSLSTEPLIILLDDPTRGVDVGAKSEVHEILNRLTAQGCGVILVSSELPEVLAMSDRVVVMYRGEVRATLKHENADRDMVMSLATGVGGTTNGGSAQTAAK